MSNLKVSNARTTSPGASLFVPVHIEYRPCQLLESPRIHIHAYVLRLPRLLSGFVALTGYDLLPILAGDGINASGLSYIRVPLGASDFSESGMASNRKITCCLIRLPIAYSYDDTNGDVTFAYFNIDATPSYVFEVINDIQSINDILKVHILPWSPVSR